MHKIVSKKIDLSCFETDDFSSDLEIDFDNKCAFVSDVTEKLILFLESLRLKYLETNDTRYWKELIRWLPSSWLQTRTVTMSYENLYAICSKGQRRHHKLSEWSGKTKSFIEMVRGLPYAQEFIFIDEIETDVS